MATVNVNCEVEIEVSWETANKCLEVLAWYLDAHPEYSVHANADTIEGKLKHRLWFYKKRDDWKMGGTE